MSCPHCHNKVILSDGNNLIPYEEQTNISGEITQLTKELQKLKIDEGKKQSELSSYKMKTERYKTLKVSIDVLEKDMEEGGDIDEEIESLECYKSENISSEKQIQELENNIKHNQNKNIILYNFACGDNNCYVKMPIIEEYTNMVNMGDITPDNGISNNFSITKSVILDEINFPSKIDFIKIDVQGWEKKVLLGCKERDRLPQTRF
jgi:FkbM family methyltransferase